MLPPILDGNMSLEKAIYQRRTTRSFSDKILTLTQFFQLLWAAQGVTRVKRTKRVVPSAGALYPLDIYGIVGSVEKLSSGVYHYKPFEHSVSLIKEGDIREDIARVSLKQMWMVRASLILVITAEYGRTTGKYGRSRGVRYVLVEAGHVGQNILLQSQSLGLGSGIVGAFKDRKIAETMEIEMAHEPLLLLPIG